MRRAPAAALLLVAVAAVAAYLPAFRNGWAIDDLVIVANPLLRSLRTLPAAMASPWWYPTQHLYRPLTTGTIGLELLLGGGAPWLPHATNVLLHALVATLVARLCLRWLPLRASVGAGLLFALLPGHVEAVATLAARAELLAALPLVGLMLLATRGDAPTVRTRFLAALLAFLALASKEGGVAAPVLALAAAWTEPASRRHAWRWAAAAAIGTIVMLLTRVAVLGFFGGDQPHTLFRTLSEGTRVDIALSLLPRSAAMLLLPMPPAINYTPSLAMIRAPHAATIALGAVLLAIAVAGVVAHARWPSVWTLGAVITAATLAPTSNLLFGSGVVLSGRNSYAPSVGAALVAGAAFAWLSTTRARRAALALGTAYLAWLAAATWREASVWRSSSTAIAAASARAPESYWVPMCRAYLARAQGRRAEALEQFRRAATLLPLDWEMLADGASLALERRDTTDATTWLRAAIAAQPGARRARTRLAAVLIAGDSLAEARRVLQGGIDVAPDDPVWRRLLARTAR